METSRPAVVPTYLRLCFVVWTQCNSESSRSEDASSDGEEEEDSSSLSPSSSLSCSKAGQGAGPDSPAPRHQAQGSTFLSAMPAQWSVEEVCRFISSLQGKSAGSRRFLLGLPPTPLPQVQGLTYLPVFVVRLRRAGGPLPVAGNRRAGAAAAAGGPPHLHHEHQAGPRPQDLRLHQHVA